MTILLTGKEKIKEWTWELIKGKFLYLFATMAIGMSNIFKMEKEGPVKKKESTKENEQAKV